MDYETLKKKYEKKLNHINDELDFYKNSSNAEIRNSVPIFEREKEEVELILKAICDKLIKH